MIDLMKSAIVNDKEPIDLYNWFKKYPYSNKRVICYCEKCGIERNISYRQYHVLCRNCANEDPIKIKKRRDGSDEYWSHQENRDDHAEKVRQYYIANPDAREDISRKMIEYYSYQENRNTNSERKKEYFSHQENRDDQAERTKQYAEDHPETPEMLIERSKRISAGLQGIPYEEWKDFIYNQNDERLSLEARQWRSDVLERDNNTCQICYQHGGDLNAHHIRRWIDYPELRYDIDNGITLCVDCHFETYNKENDYIEFLEKRQR